MNFPTMPLAPCTYTIFFSIEVDDLGMKMVHRHYTP